MLTDILWMIEARMQYERQKAQGLVGLIALISVIFMVWKWNDWFYPLFNKLGLVDLAHKMGLVHELPVVTVINVVWMIGAICFLICIFCFAITFIGFLLMLLGASKLGQSVIATAMMPVLLPYLLIKSRNIQANVMNGVAKNKKELKEIVKKYKDLSMKERNFRYYLHQLENSDPETRVEIWNGYEWRKAKSYLNRVLPSIKDNNIFLIGYIKGTDKLYILFPNPLPEVISHSFYDSDKERGLYGYESQCLRASLTSNLFVDESYEVPAIEVSVKSGMNKFYMEVGSDVTHINLKYMKNFYKVSSGELNKIVTDLSANHMGLQKTLERAHIAFYLFPIVYQKVNENIQPGIEKYHEQKKEVLNAETLYPIYEAMVVEKIIEFAKNGKQWAIDWFKKVE